MNVRELAETLHEISPDKEVILSVEVTTPYGTTEWKSAEIEDVHELEDKVIITPK